MNPENPYEVELRHNANGDPQNYWRDALMERRISVSTAEPFCVSATIPQALRIALGSVPFDSLRPALLSVRDAVEYEQYR